MVGNRSPNRILDVGCATGEMTRELKRAFPTAQVVGVDFVSEVASRAKATQEGCEFLAAGLPLLPFKSESFDLVVASEILYYSPQDVRHAAWNALLDVLSVDGLLIFTSFADNGEKYMSVGEIAEKMQGFSEVRYEYTYNRLYFLLSSSLTKLSELKRACEKGIHSVDAQSKLSLFVLKMLDKHLLGSAIRAVAPILHRFSSGILSWKWLPESLNAVSALFGKCFMSNVLVAGCNMKSTGQVLQGRVCGAELCESLRGVKVFLSDPTGQERLASISGPDGSWTIKDRKEGETVKFTAPGYVDKYYDDKPPELVRLLEDKICAYQDKLWFVPGEVAAVRVHSPVSYTAVLFRYGIQKEIVSSLGKKDSQLQRVPDGKFVDFGPQWEESFKYQIPTDALPGLYSLALTDENGACFAIPFVVSTPRGEYGERCRLLVLASTTTWHSYNVWGGRSRYRNFEDEESSQFMPSRPNTIRARTERFANRWVPQNILDVLRKVLGRPLQGEQSQSWRYNRLSITRPFPYCGLESDNVHEPFTSHLAAGEWRVLAWLEREGFKYDIVSGADLHENPDLLAHYDAVILSTHCEYWTREMFAGLKRHHENNGLWVLNLSGNSIYREIKFYGDGSICWRGLFHETCADESAVTGVRLCLNAYGTCAPFKIKDPGHWVFQGLKLPRNKKFGLKSLNTGVYVESPRYNPSRPGIKEGLLGSGASGWETDRITDTSAPDVHIVAQGCNPGGADMVVREPKGGRGGMFSASSIVFGGALLLDDVASGMVANVLTRSLQAKNTNLKANVLKTKPSNQQGVELNAVDCG